MSYEWMSWAMLAVVVLLAFSHNRLRRQRDAYKQRAELLKAKADKLLADYLKELSEHTECKKRAEELERKNKALQDLREQMDDYWHAKYQKLSGRLGSLTQKYNKLKNEK